MHLLELWKSNADNSVEELKDASDKNDRLLKKTMKIQCNKKLLEE